MSFLFANARIIEMEKLLSICVAMNLHAVSVLTLIDFLTLIGRAIRTNETFERFLTKP